MTEAMHIQNLIDLKDAHIADLEQRLGNLLALIHCDGGHYIVEHGWAKAEKDAREVWNQRGIQSDKAVRLEAEVTRLRAALEQMLASAVPHPTEHPTMTTAWENARKALAAPAEVPEP